MIRHRVALGIVLALGALTPAVAQTSAGTVLLPPGYDAQRTYPVVVFLPATGATAENLLNTYLVRLGQSALIGQSRAGQLAALTSGLFPEGTSGHEFVLVLAAGQATAADYSTGDAWTRTIGRFEQGIRADIAALATSHRIDTTKVVLAGFSMGGDLAWALAVRNPGLIHGAVAMSSRATYRSTAAGQRTLAASGGRYFFTMGAEDTARLASARLAVQMLDGLGIANRLREIPAAGHVAAPPELLAEGLAFVLGGPDNR